MNLYRISQDVNREYDTYDSAVVAAESEEQAKQITPNGSPYDERRSFNEWASPKDVKAEYIGIAKEGTEAGVILASYNAG